MVDILVGCIIILIFVSFFYFAFYRKRCRYNKLIKRGLKIPAKIISINKTDLFVGDDSFAIPIMEIVFELEYPKDTTRKETIRHAFNKWETIPKKGDKITIFIDKANPHNFDIER
ncbi:hypothetical protein ACFQ3S_06065 [Mucilaginibacter terrae]|uniref:hypothetical protein n=1 Tax=Mucilaginibacter terrae TaxID=1955052 RepID=UPI00363A2B0F